MTGGISNTNDLNMILIMSTQELLDCQKELIQTSKAEPGSDEQQKRIHEQKMVDKLVQNLDKASSVLAKEIDSGRVVKINPETVAQMEKAIEAAMKAPMVIDAKINEIYLSVFGWNTALWHSLNRMLKLLKTPEVMQNAYGIRVAKVAKSEKGRRKRRGEK